MTLCDPVCDLVATLEAIRVLRGGEGFDLEPGSQVRALASLPWGSTVGRQWRENAALHLEADMETYLRAGMMAPRTDKALGALLKTLGGNVGDGARALLEAAAELKRAGRATAASKAYVGGRELERLAASMLGS